MTGTGAEQLNPDPRLFTCVTVLPDTKENLQIPAPVRREMFLHYDEGPALNRRHPNNYP